MKLIKIHPRDNVAVALADIAKGEVLSEGSLSVTAAEDIARGHKIALRNIAEGEAIIKYGNPIGLAKADIAEGSWVHVHNVKTGLSESAEYRYDHQVYPLPEVAPRTFMGYRREDGRAAVRNEIWIIPTVGCVNHVAMNLVEDNQDLVTGSIDGLYTFTHPYGCSQMGDDHAKTRKLLASLVRHPNAGAVLVLSLGCENLTQDQFKEELGQWDENRVKFLVCQNVEDEFEEGRKLLKELAEYAGQFKREPIPASELVVGMKCGGSDGLSGITANPTVGRFSDRLIALGGSTVLTSSVNYATPGQLILKRIIDILGGLAGSLLALIIMAIVGPMIKKASPGPILYRSERIGQNGKRFKMIKIRSMYLDADARKASLMAQNRVKDGMMFKLDFDPRIIGNEELPDGTRKTGIGEFIRKTSLDEFPQFFNVLKGDMSLVGTRPPTPDEWEKYEYHHRARLATKPGITGMWQVSGRSEITDFEEVVRLDTKYIQNWTIGMDIKILFKTVLNVLTRKGAM